ncbi:MAG: hypothetical protein J5806_06185 [Lentisphaeria bacterium]|nr:hypothetical protein [Lentisphaeria bacterium]
MNSKFLVKNGIFLAVFLGAALLPYQDVSAQGGRPVSTPDRRVSRELWDIWRQGFEYYDKGEMKMISGKYAEALPLYQKSLESFQEVRRQNPQWNRNVIEYRMTLCRRRLMTAKRRADDAADEAKRALNRSSLPVRTATSTPASAPTTVPAATSSATTSTSVPTAAGQDLDRQLRRAIEENELRKKQIEELQRELARVRPGAARADAAQQQIRGLMAERTNLENQLASIKLQLEKIQEEQRKNSPRTAELERLLTAEQNKSSAYAKAFRERSAAHAQLEAQLKALTAELARKTAQYDELNRKYTVEQQASGSMVRENAEKLNALSESLKKSQAETARLKNQLAQKNREYEKSADELRKLRAGRLSADELTKKVEADALALRQENAKVKAELEKLRSGRAALETRIADLNTEVAKLRKDLVINIEQRNDFARANDSISKQFGELEKSFRKLRDENNAIRKQLDAAVKEREMLAAKVNDRLSESLRNQLAAARQEVERLTAERNAAAREIAQLKRFGDPAVLKADAAAARSKQAEAEQVRSQVEVKLAEERRKLAAASAALAASQSEVAVLEAKMKNLQLEAGRSAAEVKMNESSMARLTAELKSKNDQLIKAAAEAEQLRKQQLELAAQLDKATANGIALQKQNDELATQLKRSGTEPASLRQQNEQLAAQLRQLRTEMASVRKQNEQNAARLAQADAKEKQLLEQQSRLTAQMERQRRNSDRALRESLAERDKLQSQLKSYENDPARNPSDQVRDFRRQIAEAESQKKVLMKENADLRSQSQTLRQQAADSAARDQAQQTEQEALRKQVAELQDARKKDQERIAGMVPVPVLKENQAKYDALAQQHAALEKEKADLEAQTGSLRKQVAELQDARKKDQERIAGMVPIPVLKKNQAKYDALAQKHAALEASAAETGRQLAASKQQNELLTRQLNDTTGKLVAETKQNTLNTQELNRTRKLLTDRGTELTDSRVKVVQYQQVMASHEKQRQELLKEIAQLQNTLRSTAAERAQLVRELERVKSQIPAAEEFASMRKNHEKGLQEIAALQKDKTALEGQIAELQAKLGSTQARLAENQRTLAAYEGDIARLRAALMEFESTQKQLAESRKKIDSLRQERGTILKNSAVREQNLKVELQQNVRQVFALRDENTRNQESIRSLTARRDALEKEMTQASAQIADLKKQLAKALSEEEKVQLKKQIADLNAALKTLAEGSENELVREAANKNLVISDLIQEQQKYQAEIRKLNKSAESYRILAMRQRENAEKAENTAQIALYDARQSRAELKMLRADIVDGVVKVPESRRLALAQKKRPRPVPETPMPTARTTVTVSAPVKENVKTPDAVQPPASKTSAPAKPVAAAPAKTAAAKSEELSKAYRELMKKGADAEQAGDLGMALWHYWQAADAAEKRPEPYFALARLHLKRKELESALKAYEKAIGNGGERDAALEKELNRK